MRLTTPAARLWWRQFIYGQTVQTLGPSYLSHEFTDGSALVTFKEVGNGLTTAHGDGITGFQLRDSEGDWWHASAQISAPNQVTITHADISEPTGVRYAWSKKIAYANLYNDAGLPAVLFQQIK